MKANERLYKEHIETGVGQFELWLNSTDKLLSSKTEEFLTVIHSSSYDVVIKQVLAPTIWLPSSMSVDAATAWLFYITKRSEAEEQLTICFELLNHSPHIQAEVDSGEWLQAMGFEDGIRQVHIGTQDEMWFAQCGEKDWMPQRLAPALNNDKLFVTAVQEKGLKTTVPDLRMGEQFYLHYVLAESPRRKSNQYLDDWDVSTWYAVDQPQKTLQEDWAKQTREAQ
jgi:hypothetical protein